MTSDTPPTIDNHDAAVAHPVPLGVLVATFAALLILTVVTVVATWADLGSFNVWLALLIAATKASLVGLYFMHLRWDSRFNAIVLIAAMFFLALFIGIVVLDSKEYRNDYNPPARQGTPLQ